MLQTSIEQIFSAAPLGLGLFFVNIPGAASTAWISPRAVFCRPLGADISRNTEPSYQASPNGAKDYSQGIHPLVNEAKFCPSPNGAAESPGPHIIPISRMATDRSSHRQGHKHVRGTARPATASYFSSIFVKENAYFVRLNAHSARSEDAK